MPKKKVPKALTSPIIGNIPYAGGTIQTKVEATPPYEDSGVKFQGYAKYWNGTSWELKRQTSITGCFSLAQSNNLSEANNLSNATLFIYQLTLCFDANPFAGYLQLYDDANLIYQFACPHHNLSDLSITINFEAPIPLTGVNRFWIFTGGTTGYHVYVSWLGYIEQK